MSSYRILPLPLYVHYAEMQGNVHLTEVYEDGEKLHMEKLTPMRIFGTIVEIHEDDTISFQWAKDKRNLHEYQNILNEYYELQPIEKNIQLKDGVTYIVHYDGDYCRCQVVDVYSIDVVKTVHLIDYGKTVRVDDADFFYFHHEASWNDESLCFAFAGACRLADKNQCLQLGIPSIDQFVPGEEVEIFLLSSHEPYYAVVSSLRNPEAKLLDDVLTIDLSPDVANSWAEVIGNQLSMVSAVRPTYAASPKWIHGTNPVLVTIPYIEDLNKVAVCDLLCALRACILSEVLRDNYEKPHIREAFSVMEHLTEIGIGVIVVALDPKTNRYYRARICETNASMTFVDLIGIDFPQWKSFNHPLTTLWLLSKSLENFPRMLHYVPLQRNHLSWSPDIKLLLKELIRTRCEPYTVAVLKHKDETLEPEILVADGANKPLRLIDFLPVQEDGIRRTLSTSSLNRQRKTKRAKKWLNKSAKEDANGFKIVKEQKKAVA